MVLGGRYDPSLFFAFHTVVDGWLLTHAGLSASWVPDVVPAEGVYRWLSDEAASGAGGVRRWQASLVPGRSARCGEGTVRKGGILWCDFRESCRYGG